MDFELQKRVTDEVKRYMDLAKETYNIPKFNFNLEFSYKLGRIAGQCKYHKGNKQITVIYNAILLPDNIQEYFNETIAHEVAHAVEYYIKGKSSHGRNWKSIMRTFGVNPERTHNMDTRKSAKGGLFLYKCEKCSAELEIGKIRHNRLQKNPNKYSHPCSRTTSSKSTLTFIKSL